MARQGRAWKLRFAGKEVHAPDEVGLGYLAVLLRSPGQDVHVSRVIAPQAQEPVALSGGDEILDKDAVSDYKAACELLEEKLLGAQADHDIERVQAIKGQLNELRRRLKAAEGLRHRPRKLGAETEKERKRVSMAIKRAVARLEDEHPALHAHLDAFISCGEFLSYRPDRETTWLTL